MNHQLLPPIYPSKRTWTTTTSHRVCSTVDHDDYITINSMGLGTGILSHIIDHAIHTTAEYIRTNGLTYADHPRFLRYLRERSFVEPAPVEQAQAGNDGRRTPEACAGVENPPNVPQRTGTDAQTTKVRGGRKASGGKG